MGSSVGIQGPKLWFFIYGIAVLVNDELFGVQPTFTG